MIDMNLSRKSNGIGTHDQIIHFDNGEKRYIQGVVYIWENQFIHIVDYLGVEYIINRNRVLFAERFSRKGQGYKNVEKDLAVGRLHKGQKQSTRSGRSD